MHQYLETMKYNTPPSQIYEKLRKIRERPPRRINTLCKNGIIISNKQEIVDCLAETFAGISNPSNCSAEFKKIKDREERKEIEFESSNSEPYNELFTMTELTTAINSTKATASGPDKIHYSMFKHLPEKTMVHILYLFNQLWVNTYFPDKWKEALTIPMAKPNKDHSNPTNYRPIALTSCFCKVFEEND